ncbi:amino acid ABC transporter substrate-binding protein [Leptolyngbya sp. BL0902]|uniref:substrate-binding periplasmic protein n=1 Tax=Leptolyngbya sp. BL0902 TaxID=1115757 RepID=UPI0018E827D2|nr:ABC transporter substrate-binding protein [Leptolyngbya sp. BL0902]QQE67206.1 amino acid ABC transporter substrate-binding protein [Leptolyngbya sp. BL0902]
MAFTTVFPGQLSIIASRFDARPMSFLQGDERLGYEPAVARAVCQHLGLEPVWVNYPIDQFYPVLSSGQHDVVWFNQAITQERRAWADFTRPYGRFDEAVLVREDSPIHHVQDLAEKRLGTLDTRLPMLPQEDFPDLEWVAFADRDAAFTTMLSALDHHEIDAVLEDAVLLLTAEADNPRWRVAFQRFTQQPFGVGVLPGNRELLDALNQALTQLMVDGTLARLWAQWIPFKPFPF